MNLLDMATFICGKVNLSEAEDLTACKGFLTLRHEVLWMAELWKDALTEYRQTLNPAGYAVTNNWLPVKGVLLVPPIIERVMAVRSDSRHFNVRRPEYFYRVDFDAFAKTGEPADFVLLPRCVWEFETAQTLYAIPANAADAAALLKTDTLDADGTGVTRTSTALLAGATALPQSDRIDAALKTVSQGSIALGTAADGSANFLTMAAADQAALKRERVRLVAAPSAALTLRLLGKRLPPSFSDDLDEAGIRGVDNCLIAFGQADMLERERHYAKAQSKQQEAVQLLSQLKEVEVVQQAHNAQIVPEQGYGDEYFQPGAGPGFFF